MRDNWPPNWRDSEAYLVELTDEEGRWEFLRRDEDYQADYAKCLPKTRDALANFVPTTRQFFQHYDRALMQGCYEKYGVDWLENPAQPGPPPGFLLGQYLRSLGAAGSDEEHIFRIPFNVRRPLGAQLDQAKWFLSFAQETMVEQEPSEWRRHREKWPHYLRLLDAKAAGETNQEIVTALELEGAIEEDAKNPNARISEQLASARKVQAQFKAPGARWFEARFMEIPEEERELFFKDYLLLRQLWKK